MQANTHTHPSARVQAMVASVPQRWLGASGMIVPSWGRGRRRPEPAAAPTGPPGAASGAPVSRSPGPGARGGAGPGPCHSPRQRTVRRPDLVDQPDQVGVADRGGRPGAGRQLRLATGIDRGARRAEHAADQGHWQLLGHGYLGRFAGGIWSPLFSARACWFSLFTGHDRHLHPCLSGVQENRERWNGIERTTTVIAMSPMTWSPNALA